MTIDYQKQFKTLADRLALEPFLLTALELTAAITPASAESSSPLLARPPPAPRERRRRFLLLLGSDA
jgi:hypothetical protein